jgi:hypothetical protein
MNEARNLADAISDFQSLARKLRATDPLRDIPRDWFIVMHHAVYYQYVAPLLSDFERVHGLCGGRRLWLLDTDPFDGNMAYVSPGELADLSLKHNRAPYKEADHAD